MLMCPRLTWIVFATLTFAAIAELLSPSPSFPPMLVGTAMLLLGLLAGLRWGADSASRLISDLSRTNSYLAEQNDELSELNYELLSRLNDAPGEGSEQERPHD